VARDGSSVGGSVSAGQRAWAHLRAWRPVQWSKNVLLAVPLVTGHAVDDPQKLWALLLAFIAFSFTASAVYLINDLADRESDRQHPRKCRRPIATGQVTPTGAIVMAIGLIAAAGGLLLRLPAAFAGVLVIYLLVTSAYSAYFKTRPIVDVLVLAGLYVLRIVAGGVAVDLFPSAWLLAFGMFIFIALAFAKRYSELLERTEAGLTDGNQRRGYQPVDLPMIASAGITSGYLSVLVFALYLNSDQVRELYAHSGWLWLACPLLLYWITRIWLLARRGTLHDDPVVFTLTDGASYACAAILAALIVVAS